MIRTFPERGAGGCLGTTWQWRSLSVVRAPSSQDWRVIRPRPQQPELHSPGPGGDCCDLALALARRPTSCHHGRGCAQQLAGSDCRVRILRHQRFPDSPEHGTEPLRPLSVAEVSAHLPGLLGVSSRHRVCDRSHRLGPRTGTKSLHRAVLLLALVNGTVSVPLPQRPASPESTGHRRHTPGCPGARHLERLAVDPPIRVRLLCHPRGPAVVGLLKKRRPLVAVLAVSVWALAAYYTFSRTSLPYGQTGFDEARMLGLVPLFFVGALLYLYRDTIPDSGWLAFGSAAVFIGCMWLPIRHRRHLQLLAHGHCDRVVLSVSRLSDDLAGHPPAVPLDRRSKRLLLRPASMSMRGPSNSSWRYGTCSAGGCLPTCS